MTFQKILTSMTSDFYARNNSPTCAWPKLLLEKIKKISKKCRWGRRFQKSRFLTPPNRPKSDEGVIQSTWDQKTYHFLAKSGPHAKN